MLADRLRLTADRLITKFGSAIVLTEHITTTFNPTTGDNLKTSIEYHTKAHISPYTTSDIVSGVVGIKDLRFLIYADGYDIDEDWTIEFDNQHYTIINISKTIAQNKRIVLTLQCRCR